jgi:hypothetical protein
MTAVTRYIKQPTTGNLANYVDAELRKIESAFRFFPQIVVKKEDTSRVNNTFSADPELQLRLGVGYWDIEFVLGCIASNANPDIKYAFKFTGTVAPAMVAGGHSLSAGGDGTTQILLYDSTTAITSSSSFGLNTVNQFRSAFFRGVMQVATPGVLEFHWAQITTDAVNPTTVKAGSVMYARGLN